MVAREKPPVELAARALCRLRGLPEDTRFNGAPMWHSLVSEVIMVLEAVLPREDLGRLIPGYPAFPDLHDPKRKSDGYRPQ